MKKQKVWDYVNANVKRPQKDSHATEGLKEALNDMVKPEVISKEQMDNVFKKPKKGKKIKEQDNV